MGDNSNVILPNRFKKLLHDKHGFDKNRNIFYKLDPLHAILTSNGSSALDRCKDCLTDNHKQPVATYSRQSPEKRSTSDNLKYTTSSQENNIWQEHKQNNDCSKDNNVVYLNTVKPDQKGVDLGNQEGLANQQWKKSHDMMKTNIDNHKKVQDMYDDKGSDKGQGKCTVAEIFQALSWIREQILQMKEEDKILMQQFLDLRARIRNLKSHIATMPSYSFGHPYNSEISVSHLGIDEACEKAYPMDLNLSPNQEEDYLGEFRERTVSMHLVKPKKKPIVATKTIRKYRTEEYL